MIIKHDNDIETRINERYAELASNAYFGGYKFQLLFQTLNLFDELFPNPGKENDYLISGNERKLSIWCDND